MVASIESRRLEASGRGCGEEVGRQHGRLADCDWHHGRSQTGEEGGVAEEQLVNQRPSLGKPLLEMCKGECGCKGLPGWFGALFSTFARLTEGVGSPKLFGQGPIEPTHFKKGLP